jgi:hypothetical protein
MSEVYRAQDTAPGRTVAVKILSRAEADDHAITSDGLRCGRPIPPEYVEEEGTTTVADADPDHSRVRRVTIFVKSSSFRDQNVSLVGRVPPHDCI